MTGRDYSSPANPPQASSLQSRVGQSQVATDPEVGAREQKVRRVLERMLEPPQDSQLTGTPVSLATVVASATTREDQALRIEAYWNLTAAAADYYLGVAEVEELSQLRKKVSTYSTSLNEAQSTLATRADTSLKAARVAQHRLARMMGGAAMPLPADIPFTGPYATRLSSAFPGGAPAEARLIHELLPLRLAELQDGAEAVSRSAAWFDRVRNETGSGGDETGIVRALELNALNRRAFVMLARDYNLQISRYTQLFAPERLDTGRLVAMLIRTPRGDGSTADDALMAGFSAGSTSGDTSSDETNSASRDSFTGGPSRR